MKQFTLRSFFVIALLFSIIELYSQTNFGATVGLNLTNSKFSSAIENNKFILRYNAGLFSEFSIGNKFKIEPTLLYSVKGWQFKSYVPSEGKVQMNLHYINLQLIGKYLILKKTSILTGVELGYLIKTKPNPQFELFNYFYEKNDVSLIFGTEYQLSKLIRLTLKYLHGITYLRKVDTYDNDGNPTGVNKSGYNRVLQFGVAINLIRKE